MMVQPPPFLVQPPNVIISQQSANFSSHPKPLSANVMLTQGSRTLIGEHSIPKVTTGQVTHKTSQNSNSGMTIQVNQTRPAATSFQAGKTQTSQSTTNQVQQAFSISQPGELK
jgi:hypothetical protein